MSKGHFIEHCYQRNIVKDILLKIVTNDGTEYQQQRELSNHWMFTGATKKMAEVCGTEVTVVHTGCSKSHVKGLIGSCLTMKAFILKRFF